MQVSLSNVKATSNDAPKATAEMFIFIFFIHWRSCVDTYTLSLRKKAGKQIFCARLQVNVKDTIPTARLRIQLRISK